MSWLPFIDFHDGFDFDMSAWVGEENASTVTLKPRKHVYDELRKDIQFTMTMEMI